MKTTAKKNTEKSSAITTPQPFFNLSEKSAEVSFFDQKNAAPFFTVQPKLNIGQPNDKYEQEADAVADQVVNDATLTQNKLSNAATIQAKCADCEEEEVQTKLDIQSQEEEEEELQMQPMEEEEEMLQMQSDEEEEELQMKQNSNQKSTVSPAFESQLKSKAGTGQALPKNIKQEMESGIGASFGKVRIHNDSAAHSLNKAINAQAFTHGNDIYFNQGKYDASSKSGKHLLAHELTHVVQQSGGKKSLSKKQNRVSPNAPTHDTFLLKKGKKSDQKNTKKAIAAQKKMWDDLAAFFPDAGRKLAGSGYDATIGYVRADFTQGENGGVSKSAPIMYVGSAYTDEADAAVRKAKLAPEILKIDNYRVENGLIDDKDASDSQVNGLIDKLDITKKQALIDKMKAQKYITDNKTMIEHIKQKMPSTQWTSGAVATADGGFEYQIDNVKIIVKPDVFNSSKVASGAETELTPVDQPTIKYPGYTWDGKGKINKIDFIPQKFDFTYKVQTHYSPSASPTDTSGYGVGTEAGAKGEDTHLRKHEGAHGEVFIKHMQDNLGAHPFPTFTGSLNDKKDDFIKMMKKYKSDVKAFLKVAEDAMKSSEQNVDCAGTIPIQDYYKKQKKASPVICKTK